MSLIITRGFGFMTYDDSVAVRIGFEDEDVITTNVTNTTDDVNVLIANDLIDVTSNVISIDVDVGE